MEHRRPQKILNLPIHTTTPYLTQTLLSAHVCMYVHTYILRTYRLRPGRRSFDRYISMYIHMYYCVRGLWDDSQGAMYSVCLYGSMTTAGRLEYYSYLWKMRTNHFIDFTFTEKIR